MNPHLPSTHRKDLDLRPIRRELSKAGHVPGAIYTSEAIFQREIDRLFMQDWLYVGRIEELAAPGDYLTFRITGEPIIVARGNDNELYAYYNICAHRGVEVAYGQGNTKAFRCPYHGWTYDLRGRLVVAAHMQESEGFDVASCRLQAIRLDVWRGNLFICFSEKTPPLQDFISEFEKDFAFLQMDQCRLGWKMRLAVNCNWKLVSENIMDFYHVKVLHAETFGANFSWSNDDIVLKDNGGYTLFYQAGPSTPEAKPLLDKMPWLAERGYGFACTGFMPPNFTLFGRIDSVGPIITWPIAPDRCEVDVYRLYPQEFFEHPDFGKAMQIYQTYAREILEEDRSMMESMQKAMGSHGFTPGRLSTQEKKLHHYLNSYLERIFGADLPALDHTQ